MHLPLNTPNFDPNRNQFVREREHRTSLIGLSLVFTATLLSMWLISAVLLKLGLHNMPVRYVLSCALAYLGFFGWMRIWASYQLRHPAERESWHGDVPADLPFADEGCFIVLAIGFVGLLASWMVWLFGGIPLLLEVAFEVAFAASMVRRVRHRTYDAPGWWRVLWRHTWLAALIVTLLSAGAGYFLQSKAPGNITMSGALKNIFYEHR